MRCRNCDYALWNLSARQCPECGQSFRPSDYEFLPNSVRFCCPHCDQAYYGIGAKGHIEPRRFECVSCQRTIDLDEMVLRPAQGVDETSTGRESMPWLERQRIGAVRALFRTIGAAMTRPTSVIRAVPREHSTFSAWLFMFMTNLLYQIIGAGLPMAVAMIVVWLIGRRVQGLGGMFTMILWQTWWQFPLAIALIAVVPVLWMWLTHLLLQLAGAASEPMRRTAHCIYYSSPANALSAIPCGDCTQLAGKVWWLVSAILMVKDAHRCSGGVATFAVLVAGIVSWGVSMGGAFVLAMAGMGGMMNTASMAGMGANLAGPSAASSMWAALNVWSAAHDDAMPAHALQLAVDGSTSAASFSVTTNANEIPVGDFTLAMFQALTAAEQQAIVNAIVADLPEQVVAHRVGDFVFTYHGMKSRQADQRLWVLLVWPAANNTMTVPGAQVTVCRGDGSTVQYSPRQFTAELQAQNTYRRSIGLPPLPTDLLQRAPGEPAVAVDDAQPPVPAE